MGAIEPTLLRAEAERARNTRVEDIRAHHYYLRATSLMAPAFTNPTGGALDEARSLLAQAIELDPNYAPALALAGYFEAKASMFGQRADEKYALDLVECALKADPEEPLALGGFGFVSANSGGDLDRAAAYIDRALALNANSPLLWNFGTLRAKSRCILETMIAGSNVSTDQCGSIRSISAPSRMLLTWRLPIF